MPSQICGQCGSLVLSERCPHCKAPRTSVVVKTAAILALGLSLGACDGAGDDNTVALYGAPVTDQDMDGFNEGEDCDDNDADIYPGAPETAGDGVDSNCDGEDDPQE